MLIFYETDASEREVFIQMSGIVFAIIMYTYHLIRLYTTLSYLETVTNSTSGFTDEKKSIIG